MLRVRCVRVCVPRWKAGVCTNPRCSARWWRLLVLCGGGGGGGVRRPWLRRGGGRGLQPSPRSVGGDSCAPCFPPPPFGPRAVPLWARFPLPLSCFGRVSCYGRALCPRQGILHSQGILLLSPSLPRGSGRWPSCSTLPHCLGFLGQEGRREGELDRVVGWF